MKQYLKITFLLLTLFITSNIAAQTNFKFGHINSQELIALMPESDSAQAELERYAQSLQDQADVMQVELNKKYQNYLAERDNYPELIRQTKEEELNELQGRIQAFNQSAQQDMQRKQAEVMQPIVEKAQNAIKAVAAANGFTYIYDISSGIILYFSSDSEDILPLVKQKFGILK